MVSHRYVLAGLAAGLGLWTTPAAAQSADGANIHLSAFRPALDSRGYITLNASQVLGHNELSFGMVINWSRNLLVFEEGENRYEVQNIITPTLVGAYGLELGPLELELGLSVPFSIMNGDRAPDFEGEPGNPNDDDRFRVDGQGLGDVGLHLKTRLLNTSSGMRIGLAVIGSLYFATASEKDKWLGEDAFMPQVVGVLDREFGRRRRFKVSLTGGIRVRTSTVTFVDNDNSGTPAPPVTNKSIESGTSVPFGLGLAYAISPQVFDVVGEVYGEMPLAGDYFPVDGLVGIKVYLARNSFLSLGVGAGVIGGDGASPDLRAFGGIIFEPNIGDRDGDGIKDDVDQCPDEYEDRDDFEDEDGCPEPDNDGDGIPDEDDACPEQAEDFDGWEDEDGCPEDNDFDRDGDGIKDDVDQCPDEPEDKDGWEDEDGCPDPDNDGDGILDEEDLCPDEAEDFDKWEDEDGCPDPDNDKDRIVDEDDECPIEPETYNGFRDEDGCPDADQGRVVVTDISIDILDKVYFEYNSDVIQKKSYGILDAVAATLIGNPDISLVEIQGHTDARGSDSYNLRLSDRRAKSVRRYLIDKGVAPDRLTATGYGETQLIDKGNNEAAHAANRRVEFLIKNRAGGL
ncbi:OmpA family protein [Haliangium sp.]|uniref:OmpA family protein n=1 Tax=Haliangium sp. TaxID=2663208 RepID=UPI003D10E2E0